MHDDDDLLPPPPSSSSSSSSRGMHSTFDPHLFEKLVYACVKQVPKGKVCSYGDIARLCEHPKHARHVGHALRRLPAHQLPTVPWQRIINASFTISPRGNGDGGVGSRTQAMKLREEGVEVVQDRVGAWKVSSRYVWEEGRRARSLAEVMGKGGEKKKKDKKNEKKKKKRQAEGEGQVVVKTEEEGEGGEEEGKDEAQ